MGIESMRRVSLLGGSKGGDLRKRFNLQVLSNHILPGRLGLMRNDMTYQKRKEGRSSKTIWIDRPLTIDITHTRVHRRFFLNIINETIPTETEHLSVRREAIKLDVEVVGEDEDADAVEAEEAIER